MVVYISPCSSIPFPTLLFLRSDMIPHPQSFMLPLATAPLVNIGLLEGRTVREDKKKKSRDTAPCSQSSLTLQPERGDLGLPVYLQCTSQDLDFLCLQIGSLEIQKRAESLSLNFDFLLQSACYCFVRSPLSHSSQSICCIWRL